nr:hypothetical protein DGKKSRWO_DGKKSRWO_CDS_0152 [uncultured phage]CAI9752331.1 hypothetical protein CVNMHQAP_CVNMHQAP_CDS_0154 [uncultured phage]
MLLLQNISFPMKILIRLRNVLYFKKVDNNES